MINIASQLFFTEEKDAVYRFIKAILKNYDYCKSAIKRHFNENLFMSAEDKERLQSNNKCPMCDTFFDVGDNKVRHYCSITGK